MPAESVVVGVRFRGRRRRRGGRGVPAGMQRTCSSRQSCCWTRWRRLKFKIKEEKNELQHDVRKVRIMAIILRW